MALKIRRQYEHVKPLRIVLKLLSQHFVGRLPPFDHCTWAVRSASSRRRDVAASSPHSSSPAATRYQERHQMMPSDHEFNVIDVKELVEAVVLADEPDEVRRRWWSDQERNIAPRAVDRGVRDTHNLGGVIT
jgi:hypothetical protein